MRMDPRDGQTESMLLAPGLECRPSVTTKNVHWDRHCCIDDGKAQKTPKTLKLITVWFDMLLSAYRILSWRLQSIRSPSLARLLSNQGAFHCDVASQRTLGLATKGGRRWCCIHCNLALCGLRLQAGKQRVPSSDGSLSE